MSGDQVKRPMSGDEIKLFMRVYDIAGAKYSPNYTKRMFEAKDLYLLVTGRDWNYDYFRWYLPNGELRDPGSQSQSKGKEGSK